MRCSLPVTIKITGGQGIAILVGNRTAQGKTPESSLRGFAFLSHFTGLGGYLSPDRLAEDSGAALTLPQNKYQIFVFQGCSTYAYYNSAYFKLKRSGSDPKGTKNLDIITTGIGADFAVGAKVDVAFLTSVTMGQKPSWQTILDKIRAAEGESSALSHVNGDEDNPRTP